MAEYIEREATSIAACNGCNEQFGEEPCEPSECCLLFSIKTLPAADVVPVRHGRWMLIEYPYGQKTYLCSECKDDEWWKGKYAYGDELYCPHCGAKMDGDDGREN